MILFSFLAKLVPPPPPYYYNNKVVGEGGEKRAEPPNPYKEGAGYASEAMLGASLSYENEACFARAREPQVGEFILAPLGGRLPRYKIYGSF